MAVITLNQLIEEIKGFVDTHPQLQGRLAVEADDWRAPKITEFTEFPIMFIAPISARMTQNLTTHTMRVYVYMRINENRDDLQDNASDTQLILNDLIKNFNDGSSSDLLIIQPATANFLSDRELDNLVGWFIDLDFEIPTYSRCLID